MKVREIFAHTLYDGSNRSPRRRQLITLSGGHIAQVADAPSRLPQGAREVEVAAPGFVDLQINGAADALFNEQTSAEGAAAIAGGARKGGTAHILPTFISAEGQGWKTAIAAIRKALDDHVPGILGLHLEGPFLSSDKPGIHPKAAIRPMTKADAHDLAHASLPLLLTLAPEAQDEACLRLLARSGVILFAGHTNATARQMDRAVDLGVSGVTHLWNAMTAPGSREPGVVGLALAKRKLFAGIIADGFHVDPLNLRIAAQAMDGRLFLVTDAMPPLAGRVDHFDLAGTRVKLRDGRLTDDSGTLAGAHIHMDGAIRVMIEQAGLKPETAIAMASMVPAKAFGVAHELGRIKAGHRASLTFLDERFHACGGMVDGHCFESLS